MSARVGLVVAALGVAAWSTAVSAQDELTLEQAREVVASTISEARRLGAPGAAVAVVDAGGSPVAVERLDGTFAAAGTISIGKARTAALFGRPTRGIEEAINKGRTAMTALVGAVDAVPLQGGVPLVAGGHLVGAIGVSGAASAQQDDELATAAAEAFAKAHPASAVTLLDAERVREAFAKGQPLLELESFKIHASRREREGEAEVHRLDTDLLYVLSGSATFVTGGTVVEPREVAPNEIRGRAIAGGASVRLNPGDVVTVPAGTPHWFQAVDGPMTYYAVKVAEGAR